MGSKKSRGNPVNRKLRSALGGGVGPALGNGLIREVEYIGKGTTNRGKKTAVFNKKLTRADPVLETEAVRPQKKSSWGKTGFRV